jgi:phospholipid-translocating ATPase
MSSDIAIAQFRYLERLLLVHGHWCYRRISSMVTILVFKNITLQNKLLRFSVTVEVKPMISSSKLQ